MYIYIYTHTYIYTYIYILNYRLNKSYFDSVTDLRYRYIKRIPDDCVKHETNSRILHVFLISVT